MPDEDGFRDINDLLLEDDLIENELDLTGGPPIDHPIDPRLRALPSALRTILRTILQPICLLHRGSVAVGLVTNLG